jgi:hypothetical protein
MRCQTAGFAFLVLLVASLAVAQTAPMPTGGGGVVSAGVLAESPQRSDGLQEGAYARLRRLSSESLRPGLVSEGLFLAGSPALIGRQTLPQQPLPASLAGWQSPPQQPAEKKSNGGRRGAWVGLAAGGAAAAIYLKTVCPDGSDEAIRYCVLPSAAMVATGLLIGLMVDHAPGRSDDAQQVATRKNGLDPSRFHSPMVLEAPLDDFDERLYVNGVGSLITDGMRDFGKYTCDGVRLSPFSMKFSESKDGMVEVTYSFGLSNEPGADKRVTVRIELVRGGDVIASVSGDDIEVGEGERISKALSVPLKREVFGSPATLRVTVAVRLGVPAAG